MHHVHVEGHRASVVRMVVELGKTHVGRNGARDKHVHLRLDEGDGSSAAGGGSTLGADGAIGRQNKGTGGIGNQRSSDAVKPGKSRRTSSKLVKKKSLSFLMGPPSVHPPGDAIPSG